MRGESRFRAAAQGAAFAAAAAILAVWMSSAALAQQQQGGGRAGQPAAKADWPPSGPTPRTADGHPDLSGNWQPNAIRENVDLVKSGVQVPLLPAAEKIYLDHKNNLSRDDPEARCLPPGVPRMNTTPYPWTYVQTPKLLAILYEGGAHVWRKVFLDGRMHDPTVEDTWLGDSIGPLGRRHASGGDHRSERCHLAR